MNSKQQLDKLIQRTTYLRQKANLLLLYIQEIEEKLEHEKKRICKTRSVSTTQR